MNTNSLELRSPAVTTVTALLLAASRFYEGYCVAIFNPLTDTLLIDVFQFDPKRDLHTIDLYQGAFYALFAVGAVLGVASVGLLSNRFGRVPLLFLGEALSLANSFLYLVKNVQVIIAARFLSGLVAGMAQVAGIILAELLPKRIGGYGNALGYVILTTGMLTAYTTQNFMTKSLIVEYYKELLIATSSVSFIRVIILMVLLRTDTPRFLYISSPVKHVAHGKIKQCYSHIYAEHDLDAATEKCVEYFEGQGERNKVAFAQLFSKHLRIRLLSGCFLAFGHQCCGINFLVFYSTKIFDDLSGSGKSITLVIGVANFLGAILSTYLIGKLGRKFDIVWGCLMQTICLFTLLLGIELQSSWLMAVSTSGYILGFAVGFGGSYTAYLCEILPPIGVSTAMTLQWILTAAVGQFCPKLSTAYGAKAVLFGFALTSLVLFFGTSLLLIETRAKTEKEVIEQFEHGHLRFFDFH